MSGLWTPGGEAPAPRPLDAEDDEQLSPEDQEALHTELAEVQRRLAETPAAMVVANHCIGMFQLAALHLQRQPAALGEARIAIDALAAVVEGLPGRLGPDEPTLIDALAQIRLAFVQISAGSAAREG